MSRPEESTPTQAATRDNEAFVPENNDTAVSDDDNETVRPNVPSTRRTTLGNGATAPSRTADSRRLPSVEKTTEVDENGKTCKDDPSTIQSKACPEEGL
ncbi:hypothetical protein I350_00038 [Cryptococcus amylolentus CBS 6273]|uniref:Uncharacterized protein n=1 Tax=Cryptococcus amylolentus CBS 6273 TaxID=1296118 RepID=A0A1E3KEE3_9TREE|nr:hypothetical protein I350_00038 [Cryptococcus amylolentus CBS 6273]